MHCIRFATPACPANFVRLAVLCALAAVGALNAGCRMVANQQNTDGVKYFQQGQLQPAMQRFQQALQSDPKNPDAYYNLAAVYHRQGSLANDSNMLRQAEELYNRSLDYNPNHVEAHRGLAVLLVETKRPDAAFRLMNNWAQQNPRSSDARVELARLYEEFGDTNSAEGILQVALQTDVNNPRALAALGRIKETKGETAQAIANYQRSLQLNNQQPQLSERIASLTRQSPVGNYNTAPSALPNLPAAPATGFPGGSQLATPPRTVPRY